MSSALANVIWIGGSPCAGKSSIAGAIAQMRGWAVYRCDDEFERHALLADPIRQPVFSRLIRLTCDELWLRPLNQQVDEEIAFYREEFSFIRDDLERRAADHIVIAEGAALLPELIGKHAVDEGRAIWIVPTAEFQREHYAKRDWPAETLAQCSDREAAWANWMERDARFARYVEASATERNYPFLVVDGMRSLDENIMAVASWLTGTRS